MIMQQQKGYNINTMAIQTKPNFKPKREKEYRLYLIWRSMPVRWLGLKEGHLKDAGITDEDIILLSKIKTQKRFASKFGLDVTTLVEWNKQPVPTEFQELDWRSWAKYLTPNVIARLYEKIIDKPDPLSIKLWLQAADKFVEEHKVDHQVSTETLEGVRQMVEALKGKGSDESSGNNSGSDSGSNEQPS